MVLLISNYYAKREAKAKLFTFQYGSTYILSPKNLGRSGVNLHSNMVLLI